MRWQAAQAAKRAAVAALKEQEAGLSGQLDRMAPDDPQRSAVEGELANVRSELYG